jgi:hypothetical protein
MSEEEKINPGHTQVRFVLRFVGPLVLAIGLLFVAVGFGSFFSSMGSFEPPRYFWCAFAGMPLIFAGGVMCQYAFLGAVLRYQAGEAAPVGKDTFNYLAEGTQGGVRTMASAFGAGLNEGIAGASGTEATQACPACGHPNDTDAKFCDDCGAAMSKACPSCGQTNDGDAKFCDRCGTRLPG